jgi:putative Mg2+ transporter-C (MgtC) family protein
MPAMDVEPFLRMLLAAALVLPIGLERELRGKPAGLRTHVVVGTASAAFGYVSLAVGGTDGADGGRIAAQVVSGIGFMGAGVIFAAGGRVHGLTTAAALWGAAAVGLCVGLGNTALAVGLVTVLMLFLWPVDWVGDRVLVNLKREERTYQVITDDLDGLGTVQRLLARAELMPYEFSVRPFGSGVSVQLILRCKAQRARELVSELRAAPGVRFVSDEALTTPDE